MARAPVAAVADPVAGAPSLRGEVTWFDPAVEPLPGSPSWVVAALELHRRHGATTAVVRGHGAGPPTKAVPAAIGELAERFVASDPRIHCALVRDRPGRGRVIWPDAAHPARRTTQPGWIRGVGLQTGEPVWLPAGIVLLGWQREPPFVDATGLAAAPTWGDAIAAGYREVREREAVGLWWRGSLAATEIETSPSVVEALAAEGLAARVVAVGTGGTVTACVYGPAGGATVGSGWDHGVEHAMAEALMVRATVAERVRTGRTPAGLSEGLRRLLWGWHHPNEVLRRFDVAGPSLDMPIATAEPVAVLLGHLAGTPLGTLTVVRVVIPGAYRLESTTAVVHPHASIPVDWVGAPHPFG